MVGPEEVAPGAVRGGVMEDLGVRVVFALESDVKDTGFKAPGAVVAQIYGDKDT